MLNATVAGTPQDGIISPLLANIYLNSFDWYIAKAVSSAVKCNENVTKNMKNI
jgi:retron-type reverse transcriptase